MIEPYKAIEFIIANAPVFAQAKSERVYIEEFRKSLKALLMQRSSESSIGAQERDAYAHQEYRTLLEGLRAAVEKEETLRWQLVAAQARIDVYRTQAANARQEVRVTL